jgi:ferrous iron transport protein A
MSQAALLPIDALGAAPASRSGDLPLSEVAIGGTAVVLTIAIEDDVAAWLRAVGISEGERVTVLRSAAFGGPIHVRTGSGGEFALHRALAASVMMRRLGLGVDAEPAP